MIPRDFPHIDNTTFTNKPEPLEPFIDKARRIVQEHRNQIDGHPILHIDEIYVVWFTKTLQNWKALVSTEVVDGLYYEVTYDGNKQQAYLDVYGRIANRTVPDVQE